MAKHPEFYGESFFNQHYLLTLFVVRTKSRGAIVLGVGNDRNVIASENGRGPEWRMLPEINTSEGSLWENNVMLD